MDAYTRNRVYLRGSVLPFVEDRTHEFKGHRNLAVEELPPWCFVPGTNRRSRRAISRYKILDSWWKFGLGGKLLLASYWPAAHAREGSAEDVLWTWYFLWEI